MTARGSTLRVNRSLYSAGSDVRAATFVKLTRKEWRTRLISRRRVFPSKSRKMSRESFANNRKAAKNCLKLTKNAFSIDKKFFYDII